jgi:hypothetical protein
VQNFHGDSTPLCIQFIAILTSRKSSMTVMKVADSLYNVRDEITNKPQDNEDH